MEKIKKGMTKDQQEFVDLIFQELDQIPCTGWVDRKVNNPETVFEHSIKAANMGKKLFPLMKGLRTMLLIHDWAEVMTGDLRTDPLAPKPSSPEEKKEKELAAMTNPPKIKKTFHSKNCTVKTKSRPLKKDGF